MFKKKLITKIFFSIFVFSFLTDCASTIKLEYTSFKNDKRGRQVKQFVGDSKKVLIQVQDPAETVFKELKVSPAVVKQEIESSVQRFSALSISPEAKLKLEVDYVNLKKIKPKQECKVVPRVDLIELVKVIGELVADNKDSFKDPSQVGTGLKNVVQGLVKPDKLKYIIRPAERIDTLIPLKGTLINIETTEVLKYNPVSKKKSLSPHKSWMVDSSFVWHTQKDFTYGALIAMLSSQLIGQLIDEMTNLAKIAADTKTAPSPGDIKDIVFDVMMNAIRLISNPEKIEGLCEGFSINKKAISGAVAESTYTLVSNLSPILKTVEVKVFKKFPENPEVNKLLAEAYEDTKATNFDAAFDKWTQANELSSNQSWQVLANLGTYHYLMGDMEKAIGYYNQSLKIANISPKAKKQIREYRKKAKGAI